MSRTIIRIVARADGVHSVHLGNFVKEFDPDGYQGRGRLQTTNDRSAAMVFESAAAAVECWQRASATPKEDGTVNRPMVIFSVEMMEAEEPPAPAA